MKLVLNASALSTFMSLALWVATPIDAFRWVAVCSVIVFIVAYFACRKGHR